MYIFTRKMANIYFKSHHIMPAWMIIPQDLQFMVNCAKYDGLHKSLLVTVMQKIFLHIRKRIYHCPSFHALMLAYLLSYVDRDQRAASDFALN